MIHARALLVGAFVLALAGTSAAKRGTRPALYVKDVKFACKELGKECKALIQVKGIDWKKVTRQFEKEARSVRTHEEHLALLVRLAARLEDGHAEVRKTRHTRTVPYPNAGRTRKGPGMFWCRVGNRVYVKNSWSGARRVGITPGMEVLAVNDRPVQKWLADRVADLRDTIGFSTDQHALHSVCHGGLAETIGTRMDYRLKEPGGKTRKRTVTCDRASFVASGPAFVPKGLQGDKDVAYGKTKHGYGYIHYRRCKSSVPYRTDDALKAIGDVPGLILDFRANEGGGFSREDFFGRFVPPGKTLSFKQRYASRGDVQYTGPLVVIVDGMTRSAGEVGSGMFKEDGRAYMIGESSTAGMSSSKKTLDLPSGLFQLYVSVHSNMGRFNGGKGIEGIGVSPHEVVEFDPADLAKEEDTLIKRAEAIFRDWPKGAVPYVPQRFGWKAP